jgi:hypothetical protein|tara:strand:+ start:231 stop:389 length:159 start_codon:yes stop_codon:yes gene_type:complete
MKEKKEVVSFALDKSQKRELKKIKNYTQFIAALVANALGRCPVCGGVWPHEQ